MATKNTGDSLEDINDRNKRVIRRKNKKIRNLYIVIAVLILAFAGAGAYGFIQYRDLKNENKRLSNPQESAKEETNRLKASVSSLVDVPNDEEPTIATVTDVSKLKDQAFFAKAENGDKVLIYSKAQKAILYRPSTNKVIEFSTITPNTSTPDKQEGVKTTSNGSAATGTQSDSNSDQTQGSTEQSGQ